MSSLVRNAWVWLVLLASALSLFGASKAEERAFGAAAKAFNDGFWERAERQLGEFTTNFPSADNRAEAVLLRAEARLKLKNSAGAIELLGAGRATAGRLGDEYLFWLAEAQFQSGNLAVAAELYAQFATEFTKSTRLLEVVLAEASARAQLKQWARITEILQRPEGVFQTLARGNPKDANVIRGRFLLARTLFEQKQFKDAEAALQPLKEVKPGDELAGELDKLLESIQRADGRVEEALATANHLVTIATNRPALLGEGLALQGRNLEALGRGGEAIVSWQRILEIPEAPAERQREALLRVSDLFLAQNRLDESLQTLEKFLATATNSPVADIAWLAVGELRLRQSVGASPSTGTNAAAIPATNLLSSAQAAFDTLLERFPKSPLAGKAQLGRGWCLWRPGGAGESEGAFAAAVAALEPSYEQSVARFKLADARVQRMDYAGALANYQEVVASGATLPEVQSNLVERALYQILQVAPKLGDYAVANSAMEKLLQEFPEGTLAESGLLAFSSLQGVATNPAARRGWLEDFLKREPGSRLAPALRLAVARTYEQERDWAKASEAYAAWLAVYSEHPARARAEYFRALAVARSGDEAGALKQMTNFVAAFPTNEFNALAQWWVADHFWREEDFVNAERNYQLLFKTHPESGRRFEAQLMAGRAAWARQRPDEAAAYFQSLTSDTNCPPDIEAQAYFANGDMLMESRPTGTNALENFKEASKSFSKVQQLFPNTEIAVLAEGKIGECYLQLEQYDKASASFHKLLLPQVTNVTARSQAEVGLGLALEKQSLPGATNQNDVLARSLEHYLNVVYSEDADPYWVKRAGLEACRVAESLQEWGKLSKLCDRLSTNLPPLQPLFEKKKARAEEQLKKSGVD